MFFFLISFIPFLLLLYKSLSPRSPYSSWLSEFDETHFHLPRHLITMNGRKKKKNCSVSKDNAKEVETDLSLLDLPELALENILGKLSPAGLCSMSGVSRQLRERCRNDHLWERHMREKWGLVIGPAARREWQKYQMANSMSYAATTLSKVKLHEWLGSLMCLLPLGLLRKWISCGCSNKIKTFLADQSIMSWYLSLESGEFWFPAQVYNREHGHGFMLSCYDALVSYNCHNDTFCAKYPPHGRRTAVIEQGVHWDRLRLPPLDTYAHDLHVSDCLSDLRPGDHIEIQWSRNKEFPYGWWYGVVGHLELCDRINHLCSCHNSDTVILEFNHYTVGSRWRRAEVSRRDHREVGNESDGFYGGIRKLVSEDDISKWKKLWPSETFE